MQAGRYRASLSQSGTFSIECIMSKSIPDATILVIAFLAVMLREAIHFVFFCLLQA
jgi:hypothetical protein